MKPSNFPPSMRKNLSSIGERINIAKEHKYGKRIPDTTLVDKITKRYKNQYKMATSYLAELRSENSDGNVKSFQVDKLYALAEELGVTTDYLLGLSPRLQASNQTIDDLGLSTKALNNLEKLKKYSTEYPYESEDSSYPPEYKNQFHRKLAAINMLLESIEFDENNPEKSDCCRILELIYCIIHLRFDNYSSPKLEGILNGYLVDNHDSLSYEDDSKMIDDFIHKGIITVRDELTGIVTTYTVPSITDMMCTELVALLKKMHTDYNSTYNRSIAAAKNRNRITMNALKKEWPEPSPVTDKDWDLI